MPFIGEEVKKPVKIQDQIVTDEQGRRRFHGAFTGGFSAGYYNTVGSKEGKFTHLIKIKNFAYLKCVSLIVFRLDTV